MSIFLSSHEIHVSTEGSRKWDLQQTQPSNLGPGPRIQWHSDIHGRILPANVFFPAPRPISISPGQTSRMTAAELPCRAPRSPCLLLAHAWWAVADGVGCRISRGVLLATDTTPTPRCKGQGRRSDSRTELGSTSTTKLFLHFVAPGHVPGRAGRARLAEPVISLLSLFSSSLSYLLPPALPDHTRFPDVSRLFVLLASSCWNLGSPCQCEPHPAVLGRYCRKKKLQEYEIAKLVAWWLASLPLVTPRLEPALLSWSRERPTATSYEKIPIPHNPLPAHSTPKYRAVEGQAPRTFRPHESLEVTRARRAPIPR